MTHTVWACYEEGCEKAHFAIESDAAKIERLEATVARLRGLLEETADIMHAETVRADDPAIDAGLLGDFRDCDHVQCQRVESALSEERE